MKKTVAVMVLGLLLGVASSQATVTIKVLPSFGPTQASPQFAAYASSTIQSTKDGTLQALTSVTPENFMTKSDGIGTVWWWIDATAGAGETISLADISGLFTSSDSNALGKVVSLEGTTYTSTAPGIRADGSEVTSGPANQQVRRVIVGIGSKSFPVNSAQDEQDVRNYLNQFTNWKVTAMITVKGLIVTVVLSKAPPSLMATVSAGRLIVTAEPNGDPLSYGLQSSPSLGSSAVWSSAGTIRSGQSVDLGPTSGTALFVRYSP